MAWEDLVAALPPEDNQDPGSAVKTVDGKAVDAPLRNVDADTLAQGNRRYRLQGFNAPETGKFQGGVFIPGQVAGDTTQRDINRVAQAGGYTNLVPTGKTDAYGRQIARQENEAGQNIGDTATALGLVDVNRHTAMDTIRQKSTIDALAAIMPGLGASDPMIKVAREAHEKRVADSGDNPLFVPKAQVANEVQYAALKNAVGTKAVAEAVREIDRIESYLADPTLEPKTRAKLEGMLEKARDQAYIAGTVPDFVSNVAIRQGDRTLMNQAYDQLDTSFENAVLDIKKQTFGFMQLAGEQAKWEWLADQGQRGVLRQKVAQGMLPDTLSSFKDVPGSDNWETISNAATYAGNLIAGTLPMMSVLAASALAAPAGVLGFAASSVPAAMLYTGGYYADQPDDKKNPALAISAGIASAVMDRVGLDGMLGANIFSSVGRKEVLEKMLASGKYASVEAAEETLKGASKAAIIEMSQGGAEFAAKHYASKQAKIAALRQLGVGTAGEAITESGQQLLEMIAKTGEVDPDQRYEKGFYDALLDAAVGGGLMGGAFSSVGTAIEVAQWGSAANALKQYDDTIADNMAYKAHQRTLRESGGARTNTVEGATSTLDALDRLRDITMTKLDLPTLQNMEGKPGYWNGFLSIARDPMSFFRQLGNTTVKSIRKTDGSFKTYLPVLKSLMVPGTLNGDALDGFKQRIIGEMVTPDVDQLAGEMKTSTRKVNHMLRDAWQNVWSHGRTLDVNIPQNAVLQRWKDSADAAVGKVKSLLEELGYDTTNIDAGDAAFVDAAIDMKHILANEHRIVDALAQNGVEGRTARTAVADLTSGDPVRMKAAKDMMLANGIFRNPNLNDLFEPNIVNAFENFKAHLSNKVASDIYLGENGSNLAKLLHLARENGEFEGNEGEWLRTVQNVKDWYDITQGTYMPMEKYPHVEKMLSWGVTATMLASLGKAAFSSLPEIAMATLGTPGNKVFEQLKDSASTLMVEIRNDVNKGGSFGTASVGIAYARNTPSARARKELDAIEAEQVRLGSDPNATAEQWAKHAKNVKKFHKKHMGRSLFERLGFNDSGYNTQARFETSTASMKTTMRLFASLIGLRAMTDATRIASLGVSADILNTRLTSLMAIPVGERFQRLSKLQDLTVDQYQAIKELEAWGMDVPKVLNIIGMLDATDPVKLDKLMFDLANGTKVNTQEARSKALSEDATFQALGEEGVDRILAQAVKDLETETMSVLRNMTNERVVHPNTANIPKYYHDPRLRVLTTMTRFVGTMTAVVLPRLYKNYIKDGSAGMRYQAFSVIAMSVFFAHFANLLKDGMAYGDDESPYIKSNVKKLQRDIYGSGILGRGEAVVDAFVPLYPNRKPDPTEKPFSYAYHSMKDAAPPLSWGDRAVRAMYNLGTGNTEQGVKQAVRSAPIVGSYPIAADVASKQFKE